MPSMYTRKYEALLFLSMSALLSGRVCVCVCAIFRAVLISQRGGGKWDCLFYLYILCLSCWFIAWQKAHLSTCSTWELASGPASPSQPGKACVILIFFFPFSFFSVFLFCTAAICQQMSHKMRAGLQEYERQCGRYLPPRSTSRTCFYCTVAHVSHMILRVI